MIKSTTGRAALVLTGVAALALPQAAVAAGHAPAAVPAKKNVERDAGDLAAHLLDQDLTWET